MDLKEIKLEGADCSDLAHDTDKWWALVNSNEASDSVKCGEFILAVKLLDSHKGLCFIDLVE